MRANALSEADGCDWRNECYTLTEMTPADAEADCRNRGGKVPEKEGEVERCEVKADPFLVYKRQGYSFPMHINAAQADPDFVCFVYYADGHKRPDPRVMQGNDTPALAPVAVLFRRRT